MPKKLSRIAKSTESVEFKWKYQPAQARMLEQVSRGGGSYVQLKAPQVLEVGGIRGGKTVGKLLFFVQNYCLKFAHCDILVLRRTFPELKSGVVQDFKTFVPRDLYTFNEADHIATFANGSRVVFASCVREGSLIDTERGLVPIEQITTDDRVLTRKGYKRVLWSGQTGIRSTISLGPLYLTPEHPVLCNGRFIPAQEVLCLKDSEKTVRLCIQKSSFLKASHIDVGQIVRTGIKETILREEKTENTKLSTSPSGKAQMEDDVPLDSKSIITIPTISRLSDEPNIAACMDMRVLDVPSHANAVEKPCIILELSNQESVSADGVAEPSQDWQKNAPESSATANFVEPSFSEIDAKILSSVITSVVNDGTPVPVYDLTIEDQPEFFANGILVHNCPNNQERDIERYLGQSYPGILVDECGQFSPDAWMLLYTRNLVNAACEPDEYGNFPIPAMAGCTNPIGPYWEFYHTVFVKQEPWEKEEGVRKAKDGSWWAPDGGEWRLVYTPADYAYNVTTVLDNPEYIQKRDPGIIRRLQALPKAKMQKMLLGLLDRTEGQFFEPFSEDQHVIDLREDPEAIIWQDWQPVWGGQDWGMGHWNAFYLFTKALVRSSVGNDYKLKTVCFREVAPETVGHSDVEFADMINAAAYYPRLPESHSQFDRISGKRCNVQAIYFSHEKFNRVMEAHSPADSYSRLLRERNLPPVSRATRDRIGSAGFLYNLLKDGKLVVLRSCPGIISAIPALMRDPDNLDDVLKANTKADDRYDAFRYGLYGELNPRKEPDMEAAKREAMKIPDAFSRHFYLRKQAANAAKQTESFTQRSVPHWQTKI